MIYRCHTPHMAMVREVADPKTSRERVGAGLLVEIADVTTGDRAGVVVLRPVGDKMMRLRVTSADFASFWEEHPRGTK
jgi:hypothetical protein